LDAHDRTHAAMIGLKRGIIELYGVTELSSGFYVKRAQRSCRAARPLPT
jgi:hypothetical protein